MYRIAICDDESFLKDDIEECIEEVMKYNDFEIRYFESGIKLLGDIEAGTYYDIIFVDIVMSGMDGKETVKKIQDGTVCENSIIIFLTSIMDDISEIVKLRPFAYIYKDRADSEIKKNLMKAMEYIKKDRFIELVSERRNIKLRASEIMYVQAKYGELSIYTPKAEYKTRTYSLKEMEELLLENQFIKCNRGCIVNYNHIKRIEPERLELYNGEIIKISRNCKKNILTFDFFE